MYCSECRFFSDLGRCRNGGSRKSDVGYFQKACAMFEPIEQKPAKIEQNHTEIAQDNPQIEHTMDQNEQPTTKVCKACGKELPLDSFPKQVKSKDGHMNMCRDCFSAKHNHPKANAAPVLSVKEKTLADFTVDAICAELRRRGFSGTLTHSVTVEL